jgi:hypothetical protein
MRSTDTCVVVLWTGCGRVWESASPSRSVHTVLHVSATAVRCLSWVKMLCSRSNMDKVLGGCISASRSGVTVST